jgi:hypothetical protein
MPPSHTTTPFTPIQMLACYTTFGDTLLLKELFINPQQQTAATATLYLYIFNAIIPLKWINSSTNFPPRRAKVKKKI